MSDQRKGGIAWTDQTWNPIRGCSRVSEGCRHCYAETVAHRFSGPGQPYEGLTTRGKWNGTIRVVEEHLLDPLRWKRPRRVFVNSMSDLFHENVSDETIARIFVVMQLAQHHTFQVLTKRPERMLRWFGWLRDEEGKRAWLKHVVSTPDSVHESWSCRWPFPNIWLGVSVEDQATADARIPLLLQTPAAVRFISAEPLLGPVDVSPYLMDDLFRIGRAPRVEIDWLIVGGESGPWARPCDVDWIRSLVLQSRQAAAACFVKQLGSHVIDRNDAGFEGDPEDDWTAETRYEPLTAQGWQGDPVRIRLRDRKGADLSEWPSDLRLQEFPQAVRS